MKHLFLTAILTFCTLLSFAAKQPTDEQLKTLCREASAAIQNSTSEEQAYATFMNYAGKLELQTDISKISAEQTDMLFEFGGMTLAPHLSKWLAPHLKAKAEKEHGVFAFLAWKYMPRKDMFHITTDEVQALGTFLSDPELQKVIDNNENVARDVINGIASFKNDNWVTDGFVDGTEKFLACTLPSTAVTECVKIFNSIVYANGVPADRRDRIRQSVISQYSKLSTSTESQRIKKNCQTQIDYLEGPFAKGTLVGGKAPQIHFMRTYRQQGDSIVTTDITDLQSLFQQPDPPVVLLDFWGTKCVPCLQSFPEIAELQNHFDGKNVLIIGITSLQGYFVDTPNHRTIQCRNNPEKEISLFPDYMKAMGINWTIGISEENVMNTDYGALAIPHITVIDKQGNVIHNALTTDNEGKIKILEELLKQ